MRREPTFKTGMMAGSADLTVVAPIRKGFVPSLDAVTYKTRVQRVLKTLHTGRTLSHEYDLARLFSDAVERVGRIQSIRIAIVPEDQVMLAVTFDGSWESYIRVIWQKVSRSLDLIFCNTEGYKPGWENSFEDWCAWLRWRQAETPFLYAPPQVTSQDFQFLHTYEWWTRRNGDAAMTDTISVQSAERIADDLVGGRDPRNLGEDKAPIGHRLTENQFKQGMRSLAGLYRLADVYVPGSDDEKFLRRGCVELLREFGPLLQRDDDTYRPVIDFARQRFAEQIDWMTRALGDEQVMTRRVPAYEEPRPADWADVQGGIITPYQDTWFGCVLLLRFADAADLAGFLGRCKPTLESAKLKPNAVAVNIGFTPEGLRLAGLSDDEFDQLPEEFRQGMAARAGVLGDVRVNHPLNWRLPRLLPKVGAEPPDAAAGDAVQLSAAHAVLQLRVRGRLTQEQARSQLWKHFLAIEQGVPETSLAPHLLSLQWLDRQRASKDSDEVREHFGFLDTGVDPALSKDKEGQTYPNRIHVGEIIVGHPNAADFAKDPLKRSELESNLLHNGSFLVLRKLSQDVPRFRKALAAAAATRLPPGAGEDQRREAEDEIAARMLGRWPARHAKAGQALMLDGPGDDFDYSADLQGQVCPFHAHIRRANPRIDPAAAQPEPGHPHDPAGARPARILRRSMSYGPPAPEGHVEPQPADRGLLFMAYMSSIGEQFEVIQRWLMGGNSAGGYSGQADPLLGIADPGRVRVFRYGTEDGSTATVELDGDPHLFADPDPFVRLEWGLYLFAPSARGLAWLRKRAGETDERRRPRLSWSVRRGQEEIARLQDIERRQGHAAALDAWKAAIEDPTSASDFTAASIWAAIRACHGGLLRTPYGVLAASRATVDAVLHDKGENLTATGYLARMQNSFGTLYLGLDNHPYDGTYTRESRDMNQAIMALAAEDVQAQAQQSALAKMQELRSAAEDNARRNELDTWEVTFDLREVVDHVLADFCEKWAGFVNDGKLFERGGIKWTWQPGEPVRYPGHFMAPSRYTFWPHPGAQVVRLGTVHGMKARESMEALLQADRTARPKSKAPLLRAAVDAAAAKADATYPARTLAGVLMGFLPTTDGNLRRVFAEWLAEGTLWRLRSAWARDDAASARDAVRADARRCFRTAMQLRTAPDLLWRTAVKAHTMVGDKPSAGGDTAVSVDVRAGDIVVASLISAAHQCLETGDESLHYAFGGSRVAAAGGAGGCPAHGSPQPAGPLHACPGYGPALAVMHGFAAAFIEADLPLQPGPGPLTFRMEGPRTASAPPATAKARARTWKGGAPVARAPSGLKHADEVALAAFVGAPAITTPRLLGTGKLLVAGDSWASPLVPESLSSALKESYDIPMLSSISIAFPGKTMDSLANDVRSKDALKRNLDAINTARPPKALLVSGGGNDLVDPNNAGGSWLQDCLKGGQGSPAASIDGARLEAFLAKLAQDYHTFIAAVAAHPKGSRIPVLVQGYDYPVPDGRPYTPPDANGRNGRGPWLKKKFEDAGVDEKHRTATMRLLIDALNGTISSLQAPGKVIYVKLSGTLEQQAGYPGGDNYTRFWHDELHPTREGARVLAAVIDRKIGEL